jgi:hypothetical protein
LRYVLILTQWTALNGECESGYHNAPRIALVPSLASGGMSPMMMALLGTLAFKVIKSFMENQAGAASAKPGAPSGTSGTQSPGAPGGLNDLLKGGLGGLLAGGAAGSGFPWCRRLPNWRLAFLIMALGAIP